MTRIKLYPLVLALLLLLPACEKGSALEPPPQPEPPLPAHFPPPVYRYSQNPPNEAGFQLGRRLFYEAILSRDSSLSCGSCHAQVHAFADHNVALSRGVDGRLGKRNSPGLANLIWYPHFNWDGGINHLEIQPLAPLLEPAEMDLALSQALQRLREHPHYPALFKAAFGQEEINSQKFFFALAQFMGALISDQSAYDQYLRGEKELSPLAQEGMVIFDRDCASCHVGPLQSDFSFRVNGLSSAGEDQGRYGITGRPEDKGAFRVPSLRNVALTAPYLHDGSMANLEQLIEAYSSGIRQEPGLDPLLPPGGFGYQAGEKEALLAFLRSLTDWEFVGDHRFSEVQVALE